ncbi:uncharacterized protein G2W53_015866 [Senna tora]|uniref:Uncharacterized protein n=1 Tax=Senna tora TaxID=362788 RepID=A0A834WX45_9FABA|nr:uncharacterized protein G2W53_015866 [Senna tora]
MAIQTRLTQLIRNGLRQSGQMTGSTGFRIGIGTKAYNI